MTSFGEINVLDLTGTIAGNFCCRLYSDYGATVVKIQIPGRVDTVREYGPSLMSMSGRTKSGMYHFLNYNKSLIRYSELRKFLEYSDSEFDLIVHDHPGNKETNDPNVKSILKLFPYAVKCNISYFAQDRDFINRPVSDLTMQALTGMCSANGSKGRAPLKEPGTETEFIAGANAFTASLSSLISRDLHGVTQSVETSHIRSLLSAFSPYILGAQYVGSSRGQQAQGLHFGLIPCKDGYVSISVRHEPTWQHMWLFFGDPDFAYDERFNTAEKRRQNEAELAEILLPMFMEYTRDDLFHGLSPLKILVGMAETVEDLLSDPHLLERKSFFCYGEQDVMMPGAIFKMSETPWEYKTEAPTVPAHIKTPDKKLSTRKIRRSYENVLLPEYPLTNTRALVLTQAWAGAYCTQILADLGMDVIQVESIGRLDPWRGGVPPKLSGMYPENAPGTRPWDRCAMFNSVNRNKQGITLDLNHPDGKAALEELVSISDVFIENFSGRVIGNLGLNYERLREINPSLVMVRMPTYGTFGPYSNYPGNGGTTEPVSGMSYLMGYEEEPPMNSGVMHTDAYSGTLAAGGALIGLKHRLGTGIGQEIDISQQEATMSLLAEYFIQYALEGTSPGRQANMGLNYAPQGCYQSSDGRWVSLSVRTDLEWGKLCDVIDRQDMKNDAMFETYSKRVKNRQELDITMQETINLIESSSLADRLRSQGIACEIVLGFGEVLKSPVYSDKEMFYELSHKEAGTFSYPKPPWSFSKSTIKPHLAAPTLGQHTDIILSELVGLPERLIEDMKESECIGTYPLI